MKGLDSVHRLEANLSMHQTKIFFSNLIVFAVLVMISYSSLICSGEISNCPNLQPAQIQNHVITARSTDLAAMGNISDFNRDYVDVEVAENPGGNFYQMGETNRLYR